MSKLNIDGIMQLNQIMLDINDAFFICRDKDLQQELENRIMNSTLDDCSLIKDFISKNKENINIEKLVIVIFVRYQEYLSIINEAISKEKDKTDIFYLKQQKEIIENSMKSLKRTYRKMHEEFVTYIEYENEYGLTIYNSDELIKGRNKKANLERFENLNEKYRDKYDIDNIFKYVVFGDIIQFFSNKGMGNGMMLVTEANVASKLSNEDMGQIKTANELHQKANEIIEANKDEAIIESVVKKEIYKYAKYINIDRMLLIVAYRLKQELENNKETDIELFKKLLTEIYSDIDKNTQIYYKVEYENEDKEGEIVFFSSEKLKNTLNRFAGEEYISDKMIEDNRRKVLDGNVNINTIPPQIVKLMELSSYEIEQMMDYSIDNFMFGVTYLDYDLNSVLNKLNSCNNISKNDVIKELYNNQRISIQGIIQLYQNGQIEKVFFTQYCKDINFSEELNIEKINEKYKEIKSKKKSSEKDEKELESLIDLYITINSDEKTEEEKTEMFDDIISVIVEDERLLQSYYEKGLIPLNVIAEWTGEEFIEKLFKENKVNLSDILSLCENGKVSETFRERSIINSELDDEQIVLYMRKGYIKSEENIIKIFEERDIYRKEADELFNNGVISKETYETILNRDLMKIASRVGNPIEGVTEGEEKDEIIIPRTMSHDMDSPLPYNEEAQEDEFIDVEISMPTGNKAYIRGEKNRGGKGSSGGKTNKLINPLVRYEFLKALKRKIPRNINYEGMGEKNPFYNYNFYILKNENTDKEITRDDIIIAERFYTDRENKKDFAMDNATYVMRFEDYLILTGKQKENETNNKRQAIKEVPGAIYVVNHRDGSWAKNLLKAITQAKYGESLNSISARNTRKRIISCLEDLYDEEESLDILNLAIELDRGEYTYVEKNGKFVRLNNNTSLNPVGNSTDDDTDGR